MKRRVIVMLLCCILVVGMLTGCGSSQASFGSGNSRTITVNTLNKNINMNNVRFYDYMSNAAKTKFNGTYYAASSVVADIYLAKLFFLYGSKFGIERHQLSSGIFSGELPLDTSGMFIAVTLPCCQLLPEQIHVINSAGQALPCHDV